MNRTETEDLLQQIGLTMDEVCAIIKKCVAWRYKTVSQLWGLTTIDDMAQEVLVYYLSTMKSTGDVRLDYYIKKYNDKQHIINLLKQTSSQLPMYTLRSTEAKHRAVSLQTELSTKDGHTYLLEEILEDEDATKAITEGILKDDFMNVLKEELDKINFNILRIEHRERLKKTTLHFNASNLPFLLNTDNYILANNRTHTQLQIFKELAEGHTKTELIKKYVSFKKDFEILKTAICGKMKSYLRTQ